MAFTLSPYLQFPENNCREAFEFYASVLGGEPDITPLSGMDGIADDDSRVMHAELRTEGMTLLGSDNCGDQQLTRGNAYSVGLMGEASELDQIRDIFAKLSEGAEVHMPFEPMDWGGIYGELTDRFGVQWAIHANPNQS